MFSTVQNTGSAEERGDKVERTGGGESRRKVVIDIKTGGGREKDEKPFVTTELLLRRIYVEKHILQ